MHAPVLSRVLHVLALHVSTATAAAAGPAAPTNGFERRSRSAWRDDEETVRVGLTGFSRNQPCASWGSSKLPTSRLNRRRLGLALVVQRSAKARGSAIFFALRRGAVVILLLHLAPVTIQLAVEFTGIIEAVN